MPWPQLRTCQQEAFDQYMADRKYKREWLAMLTPGAGKTIFALYVAATLKQMGVIFRVAVYVPSDSLRQQWADVASLFGLELLPVRFPSDYNDHDSDGFVATYAQMNANGAERAFLAITATPTLAILDEAHQLGDDKTWGAGTQHALRHAENILMLTGTPWRSDDARIPWCAYDEETGRVQVDFAYEYGNAVADNVCRAVEIHAYDGQARYLDNATEVTKSLKDTSKGVNSARCSTRSSTRRSSGRPCSWRRRINCSSTAARTCPTPAAWWSPTARRRPERSPSS
uniref:DEAD/DEAH box helicase n=1 Tax=Streptomyces sp. CA-136453 TaxID=3240050 RepID=UPI003F494438